MAGSSTASRGAATGTGSAGTGAGVGTATGRAFDVLKHAIMHAELGPGRQYLETELADRLGLSRTPIREACIRLAADGLVEIVPRRGIRVVAVAADDMAQIYDLLATVEGRAAALLAERVAGAATGGQDLPPELAAALAELDATVAAMAEALDDVDLDRWAEADARFHRALVDGAGNRPLADTANRYADLVHRARLVTLRIRPTPTDSVADHRELVAVIRSGDGQAAERSHVDHRRRAAATLVGILAAFDPNGL
ncbi:MAG: GntR family transcriptional regulator [Actinomycetota bacterium]